MPLTSTVILFGVAIARIQIISFMKYAQFGRTFYSPSMSLGPLLDLPADRP